MTTDEPDDLIKRAAKYGAGIHTDPVASRQIAIESQLVPVGNSTIGMTSRYRFVTYIVDDDPGDVSPGVADRIHVDSVLDDLAAYNGISLPEPRWYDMRYRRGTLVDAEPASPELAALETEIMLGVFDALKSEPKLPQPMPTPAAVASRCDVCGRESLLAESVGKPCGAVIHDQRRLARTRQMAHEDLAAGGRYGATPELVKIWDEYDGKCRGVMTAVIR